MIYYQYEINEQGVIIGIQSSNLPFTERSVSALKVLKIKVGKTKESDLVNL